jgi:uncharacterized membrane protein YdbT with pleckstrin-like domain
VVALIIIWLEIFTGTANDGIAGVPVFLWTAIAFTIVWLIGLADLLVQRAANTYTLRNDSLELKKGILTLKSYMIVSAGFSDLEVIESVPGRMLNYGDIIIRIQGDNSPRKMIKVRDPLKVGEQIRAVLSRPVVRIENPPPT